MTDHRAPRLTSDAIDAGLARGRRQRSQALIDAVVRIARAVAGLAGRRAEQTASSAAPAAC